MELQKVINQYHHPIFETSANSKIWNKSAERISNMDLLMLYTRIKSSSGSKVAQQGIDLVYKKIKEAFERYEIGAINCQRRLIEQPRITMPEVIELMTDMTLWQRRAFMFSLHSGLTPTETSRLSWKEVFKLNLCDAAIDILECQVRHIRIDNVFYDHDKQQLLAGLEAEIYHITKIQWSTLQEMFDNVILIDHSEALDQIKAM